jgi:hypothetical protein
MAINAAREREIKVAVAGGYHVTGDENGDAH